jgi:hypothetical protein
LAPIVVLARALLIGGALPGLVRRRCAFCQRGDDDAVAVRGCAADSCPAGNMSSSESANRLARGSADGSGGGVGLPLFGAGGTLATRAESMSEDDFFVVFDVVVLGAGREFMLGGGVCFAGGDPLMIDEKFFFFFFFFFLLFFFFFCFACVDEKKG